MEIKPHPSLPSVESLKLQACSYKEHQGLWGQSRSHLDAYIKKVAEDIVEWAKWVKKYPNPLCAYTLGDFYDELDVADSTWEQWEKTRPELKQAHQEVIRILGRAREAGAISRRFEAGTIEKVQWHYSKLWKSRREHEEAVEIKKIEARAKAIKDSGENKQTIVILPEMPRTDIVPEKK